MEPQITTAPNILLPYPFQKVIEPTRISDPSLAAPLDVSNSGELLNSYITYRGVTGSTIDVFNHEVEKVLPDHISSQPIPLQGGTRRIIFRFNSLDKPMIQLDNGTVIPMLPKDALAGNLNYMGMLYIDAIEQLQTKDGWVPAVNASGMPIEKIKIPVGLFPVMTLSNKCHLAGSSPSKEASVTTYNPQRDREKIEGGLCIADPGGYFIIQGNEYVVLLDVKLRTQRIFLIDASEMKGASIRSFMTCETLRGSTVVSVIFWKTHKIHGSSKDKVKNFLGLNLRSFGTIDKRPRVINCFLPFLLIPEFWVQNNEELAQVYSSTSPVDWLRMVAPRYSLRAIENHIKSFITGKPSELNRKRQQIIAFLQSTLQLLGAYFNPKDTNGRPINITDPTKGPLNPLLRMAKERYDTMVNRGRGKRSKAAQLQPPTPDSIYRDFIEHDFFPHLSSPRNNLSKLNLLTIMIIRIAEHQLGYTELDDRDSWANKRLDSAGRTLHILHNSLWNQVLNRIRKNITEHSISLDTVVKEFNPFYYTDEMVKAFVSKNWEISNTHSKEEMTDQLKRGSMADTFAQLNRIKIKANVRARKSTLRMVQLSQIAYIDLAETPDGKSCGLVSHLAQTARPSVGRGEKEIYDALYGVKNSAGETVIHALMGIYDLKDDKFSWLKSLLEEVKNVAILSDRQINLDPIESHFTFNLSNGSTALYFFIASQTPNVNVTTTLMINGNIVGYCNPIWFVRFIIYLRRHSNPYFGRLSEETSVVYKPSSNIVQIYTNPGRLLRPLLVCTPSGKLAIDIEQEKMDVTGINTSDRELAEKLRKQEEINSLIVALYQYRFERSRAEGEERDRITSLMQSILSTLEGYNPAWKNFTVENLPDQDIQALRQQVVNARYERLRNQKVVNLWKAPFEILFAKGLVEYVDAWELEYSLPALRYGDPDDRRKSLNEADLRVKTLESEGKVNTKQYKTAVKNRRILSQPYTHCELDPQSLIGTTLGLSPSPDHQMAIRNTLQCAKQKQPIGNYHSNQFDRHDDTKTLNFPTAPIFGTEMGYNTRIDELGTGNNIVIAIASYGDNQEDAAIIKREAIDRGLFWYTKWTRYKIVIEKSTHTTRDEELLGIPPQASQNPEIYHAIGADGLPIIGAYVTEGDVIVAKMRIYIDPNQKTQKIDNTSEKVSDRDEGTVDKVRIGKNVKGDTVITVILRHTRRPEKGDKFEARYAQKITSSRPMNAVDMPFMIAPSGVQYVPRDKSLRAKIQSLEEILSELEQWRGPSTESFNTIFKKYENLDQFRIIIRDILGIEETIKDRLRIVYEGRGALKSGAAIKETINILTNELQTPLENLRKKIPVDTYPDLASLPPLIFTKVIEETKERVSSLLEELKRSPKAGMRAIPNPKTCLIPDMIFSPLSIPSRMTLGFLIELAMSKLGALKGERINASIFRELNLEDVERMLLQYGCSYYGKVPMASGMYGIPMTCKIYYGPCFVQLLRHNVADKIQIHGIGSVNPETHQPANKRTKDGGVRFGEMERDAMIAHGAAYALKSPLMDNSDAFPAIICRICGTMTSDRPNQANTYECRFCGNANTEMFAKTIIPYSLKLTDHTIAPMGIAMRTQVSNI